MKDTIITSVDFHNYKSFINFSLRLNKFNILIGPNNCGKSTIIGAFRALDVAIRHARSRRSSVLNIDGSVLNGYRLSESSIPISLENIHTDYDDVDTKINFRLSNKNILTLLFPASGGCFLLPNANGKRISGPAQFKKEFPLEIGVIPILGPVDYEEKVLLVETVRKNLNTQRASGNFRNYWYYFQDGFEEFANLVNTTWPEMTVSLPKRATEVSDILTMFCDEKRISRELFWAGFGFQVWCQLLTHISRAKFCSMLIVDEPEIYLHADLQRKLVNLLKSIGIQIVMATHSAEFISEAEPNEIMLIDKKKSSARRLVDIDAVQDVLNIIGSVQNITLTQLARSRKILFIEGQSDYYILRRFAKKIGLSTLAYGVNITPVESGGFSSWEKIQSLTWGFEKTLGKSIAMAVLFDRDYWCGEQISDILSKMSSSVKVAHILARKEIENYLLVPAALERCVFEQIKDMPDSNKFIEEKIMYKILDDITNQQKSFIQGQYIAKRGFYFKKSKKRSGNYCTRNYRLV